MNIRTISQPTFTVTSSSGSVVASFDDRKRAEDWIRRRKGNGVTYHLYLQTITFVELGVRKADSLRLAKG
jgi:hypothetical protein